MKINFIKGLYPGYPGIILIICVLFYVANNEAHAQVNPPQPLTFTITQNLSFGAFAHGLSGGTVSITPAGARSATGDVILLNLGYSFSTAIYELVADPGTVISLLNGPDVSLPGSNGGSMTLHIGSSNPLTPFVISTQPPGYTLLYIGGTLTVNNSSLNPPGNYSGTFDITFIQE